jgi:hypothetical protein
VTDLKRTIERTIDNRKRASRAWIRSIEIDKVSIQFGGSANLIRNVEVVGDVSLLAVGQEVSILWREYRPVVILSGSSTVRSTTIEATEDHHSDHMNGGDDEINVNGLSGVLADPQNAGQLNGIAISGTPVIDGQVFAYNASTGRLEPVMASPASHLHSYILAYVYNEDHSAECNGSNRTFYMSNEFIPSSSRVYVNGARKRLGVDYSEGDFHDTIVFVNAPTLGQTLIIDVEVG